MFKIDKSNREGDPHSLVYKIFRTKLSPDTLGLSDIHDSKKDLQDILGKSDPLSSSAFLPEDKALLLSFDPVISPGDLIPEDFSHEEIPHFPPERTRPCIVSVKSEEKRELRRSSRIALLQAKSSFSLDAVKKEVDDENTISSSQSLTTTKRRWDVTSKKKCENTRKRKNLNSSNSGVEKKSKLCEQKRNSCQRSFPSIAGIKRETENTSDKPEKPQLRDPRVMKLKHMVITQRARNHNSIGCPCYKIAENVYPKFANVDPSIVVSAVNLHGNEPKFSPRKRQIALFTTRNKRRIHSASCINENYHYCFKKMQMDIPYLRKKYQMLDSVTLDYYYEMSGYSLRNTEIILQDIINGKEVICSKLQCFHRHFLTSTSNIKVQYSNSDVPIFHHYEQYPSQNLARSSEHSSVKLFREIIVEALNVLYCEEAGYQ